MDNLTTIKTKQNLPAFQKQTEVFSLEPRNFDEAMKFAQLISKTDLVPKQYKNKTADTLVAMMLGKDMGLKSLVSLQHIAVINGRPTLWGDSMLALVKSHPDCEWIEETFDEKTMTATCKVKRKNNPIYEYKFSMEDAKRAKLANKPGPWQDYPKRMLQMRARGFALRDTFPDALNGLITVEEARDYPEETQKYKNITNLGEEAEIITHDKVTNSAKNVVQEDTASSPDPYNSFKEKFKAVDIRDLYVQLAEVLEKHDVDLDKFYDHYEISDLQELEEKELPEILKIVRSKPLKGNKQ